MKDKIKMKQIFLLSITILFLSACNKKEVLDLDFDVAIEQGKTTFKVDETVNFVLSGNPNYITFYSGETGKEYQYKDRIENGVRTDTGVPLKNMTTKLNSYSYTFTAAGSYKVIFAVSNTSVYGSKEMIKELDIQVEP